MKSLAILFCFALSSCVTYQKCVDKFGTLEKPKKIELKSVLDSLLKAATNPDSLQGSTNADSIIHLVKQLRSHNDNLMSDNDSLIVVSQNQKLQLKVWYDRVHDQIRYRVNKKSDTVFIHFHDTVRVVADCPPAMVFDPVEKLPWYAPAKLWARFELLAAWVLLVLLLAGIIYSKFKR